MFVGHAQWARSSNCGHFSHHDQRLGTLSTLRHIIDWSSGPPGSVARCNRTSINAVRDPHCRWAKCSNRVINLCLGTLPPRSLWSDNLGNSMNNPIPCAILPDDTLPPRPSTLRCGKGLVENLELISSGRCWNINDMSTASIACHAALNCNPVLLGLAQEPPPHASHPPNKV